MLIRQLSWCGLELEADDGTLAVIDVLEDAGPLEPFLGPPAERLLPGTRPGEAAVAVVTHLHRDHADAAAIVRALRPGARLLRPPAMEGEMLETIGTAAAERELAEHGVPTQIVSDGERVIEGPLTLTALPAVDGSGDPQHSWLVEADGARVVHGGDTMWHGWWWRRAMRIGPVDVAFLPVNGAVVDFPHRQPSSGLPAAMTPVQAVAAAAAMQASLLVPIHYGLFDRPPAYVAVGDAEQQVLAEGERRGVAIRVLRPGEELALSKGEAA
jgi:L-ascorbate metabolism protein UlaG (beta-lactamase superfamily)